MIRIRVTDIPQTGLQVNDKLSLDLLNSRMNEAPDNDIRFIDEAKFELTVLPKTGGAELSGTIQAKYEQPCSRCLETITETISKEISLTLKAKTFRPGIDRPTTKKEWEDDVGIAYFDGEHIDLEDLLQETLILGINPYNSSHEGCTGVLLNADVKTSDTNEKEEKVSLGKLLERAISEKESIH